MPDIKSGCPDIESSDTRYYVWYVQNYYLGIRMTYPAYLDSLSGFVRLYFVGFWNRRKPGKRKGGREDRRERERRRKKRKRKNLGRKKVKRKKRKRKKKRNRKKKSIRKSKRYRKMR